MYALNPVPLIKFQKKNLSNSEINIIYRKEVEFCHNLGLKKSIRNIRLMCVVWLMDAVNLYVVIVLHEAVLISAHFFQHFSAVKDIEPLASCNDQIKIQR